VFIFHKQYTKQRVEEFLRCNIHQFLFRYMPKDNLHQIEGTRLIIVNRQCIEMTRSMKQILVLLGLIKSPPKHRTLMAHDKNLIVV
jgi:hypothetical protein